jgi:PKD repeat protein
MRTTTFLITVLLLFILFPFTTHSQYVEKHKSGRIAIDIRALNGITDEDGLQAAFSADVRSGFAPLTVTFVDQSIGEVETWSWSFGDGQTSSNQNPVHTYPEPGIYSVSLTVTDGDNYYTLEKENFIKVMAGVGECDTLDFPFAGTYTYYILPAPAQGYVSGTNSYDDLAKANVFEPGYSATVTGTFVDFAVAKDVSGTNPDVKIAVWEAANGGGPGDIIGFKTVPLNDIIDDVNDDVATWVVFNEPISAGQKFYVGAVLPETSDTLAFWTDTHTESIAGKGWEQWDNGAWFAYSSDQSWGLIISNAIHPVVCQVSGTRSNFPEGSIAVYPVPARDRIYISLTNDAYSIEMIELFDLQGNLVYSDNYDGFRNVRSVPVQNLPAGLYMIRAVSANHVLNQKVLISK